MALAAGAEQLIHMGAARIARDGDARPVVDGVAQTAVDQLRAYRITTTSRRPLCLVTGNAGVSTERVIISVTEWLRGLCEQRGGHFLPDPDQGAKDLDVTMLVLLPRRVTSGGEFVE